MLCETSFTEESDTMPQTVPRSGLSPPSATQDERAVPASPTDIHHLLRLLGAASPPESMLHSPPTIHTKPPPPYPEDNSYFDRLYDFESYPTPSPSSEESIPTLAFQPPSPYNSLQYSQPIYIKEEPNRLSVPGFASPYPLSPSGSCASYGSYNHYSSPVPQHEEYIDIEELLKENQILQDSVQQQQHFITPKIEVEEPRDHLLLRSALEDTTFQKKLNLRPVPIELGSIKMEESSGGATGDDAFVTPTPDIDKVLSMAIEQTRRDVDTTCTVLGISPDPLLWTTENVKAWVTFTVQHFNLPLVQTEYFNMDGSALVSLTEEDFNQRAPQAGSTLYAQLEIWKAARHESWRSSQWIDTHASPNPQPPCLPSTDDISDDEDSESAGTSNGGGKVKTGSTHIHLWQFLKELLASPQVHGSAIRWLDRSNGVFKIEDSVRVARLWGKRKNRPAMNYDKLSRSIRQYYKKGIMKKTERSQRLVYQFCHPYCL